MTARLLVAVVTACLVFPAGASWAHRIDEYLQATLLSLTTDHLAATVRLIPGALVSASVIAAIDRNGDGVLSADEKRDTRSMCSMSCPSGSTTTGWSRG